MAWIILNIGLTGFSTNCFLTNIKSHHIIQHLLRIQFRIHLHYLHYHTSPKIILSITYILHSHSLVLGYDLFFCYLYILNKTSTTNIDIDRYWKTLYFLTVSCSHRKYCNNYVLRYFEQGTACFYCPVLLLEFCWIYCTWCDCACSIFIPCSSLG